MFINAEKEDIIPRMGQTWKPAGMAGKILEALDAVGSTLSPEARETLQRVADGKTVSDDEAAKFAKAVSTALGRELVDELDKAADEYKEGKLGKAREEAIEVRDGEDASEQAKADAEYVVKLVESRFAALKGKADSLKNEREYLKLFELLDAADDEFDDWAEAEEWIEEQQKLKKDKDVKSEVKALEKLAKLEEELAEARNDREKEAVLEQIAKLAEKEEGTKAAEKAKAIVSE